MGILWRRPAVLKPVIVNMGNGDDRAFRGILWAWRGPVLILRSAELLEKGRDPIPIEGDVIVERARVAFVQAPAGS